MVEEFRKDTVGDLIARFLPPKAYAEQWDIDGLEERCQALFGFLPPVREWATEEGVTPEDMHQKLAEAVEQRFAERLELIGVEQMRGLEKNFLLQMIDMQWREHLQHLDHLRQVIGLRGYGQRDPLNEYKTEAFSLFEKLLVDLRQNVTRWVMTVEFQFEPEDHRFQGGLEPVPDRLQRHRRRLRPLAGAGGPPRPADRRERAGARLRRGRRRRPGRASAARPARLRPARRLGAHQPQPPCPCGSGKKFKHCHGALV